VVVPTFAVTLTPDIPSSPGVNTPSPFSSLKMVPETEGLEIVVVTEVVLSAVLKSFSALRIDAELAKVESVARPEATVAWYDRAPPAPTASVPRSQVMVLP